MESGRFSRRIRQGRQASFLSSALLLCVVGKSIETPAFGVIAHAPMVTHRRRVVQLVPTVLGGVFATAAWSEDSQSGIPPPLPRDYAFASYKFVTDLKNALFDVVQGRLLRGAAQTEASLAMRASKDSAVISQLLKNYEAKYDSPDVAPSLDPRITGHPVYAQIKQTIARLEAGTPEGESSSKFAYSLISEMTAISKLINKVGMDAPVE
eukprot:TRINITY_DN21331_c0_g2_i1.p1 TRINITY_DN21331_c0_g2~~TRINITY_DN21331_c0_g2_i1.p1  ORF type:complete len:209 (-),score=21.13 TRINITY_DN21331_c0_g2_i1:355-981(-)